jgi:hypothetical protein
MDLRMPGMDGSEAARRLRAREAELGRPRTVVIALTASVLDIERDLLQESRFDGLMAKPFPESELMDMLHRHCGLGIARSAPAPPALTEAEMAVRVEGLDSPWVRAFDQALLVGDRAEAQELLGLIPDRALAECFFQQLKEFQFEALRRVIASGRSHA